MFRSNIEVMSTKEADHESQELLQNDHQNDDWKLDVGKLGPFKKTDADLKSIKDKKKRKFYKQQNELIDDLEKIESGEMANKNEEQRIAQRGQVAVRLSFALNVLLIGIKLAIVIRSGSISVIASVIDSCLDIVSGSIIFITSCLMRRKNKYKYPAGKTRLEPLGIVVFATCMFTASFQVVTEAIRRLINEEKTLEVDIYSIAGLAAVVVIKLFLLIFCATYAKGSESAAALAQDHRNDVISNTFSIAAVLLAYYYVWWLDAAGGMAISLYIMINWAITGLRLIRMLTGKAAKREFVQKITFLCWNHHAQIKAIDTVRAYHLAHGFLVEVDIILDESMPLKDAHDIGESLQNKLERFPEVERCFVHLDYEARHAPEHGSIFEETEKEKASRVKKEEKAKAKAEKNSLKNSTEDMKGSVELKASASDLKKSTSSHSISEHSASEDKERIDAHAGKKLNKA